LHKAFDFAEDLVATVYLALPLLNSSAVDDLAVESAIVRVNLGGESGIDFGPEDGVLDVRGAMSGEDRRVHGQTSD
jgi:hypothetical protein